MDFFNDVCVLCLVHSNNIKSISSQDTDDVVVDEKLQYVLSEQVNFKLDVPKNICMDCLKNVNQSYKFKQTCLKNLIFLSKYVEEISAEENIDIKKEPEDINDKPEVECSLLIEEIAVKEEHNEIEIKQDPLLLDESQDTEDILQDETTSTDENSSSSFNKKLHKCTKCSQTFVRKINLIKHMPSHLGPASYTCGVCNKVFTKLKTFRKHQRDHFAAYRHKCDECEKAFVQGAYLARHKLSCHSDEKPHQCDVCNKAFKLPANLKKHKEIHTGDKKYECDLCDKAFTQNGNLQRHKRMHTGEKPFKCDLCDRRFSDQSYLPVHRRKHFPNTENKRRKLRKRRQRRKGGESD